MKSVQPMPTLGVLLYDVVSVYEPNAGVGLLNERCRTRSKHASNRVDVLVEVVVDPAPRRADAQILVITWQRVAGGDELTERQQRHAANRRSD